MEWVEFEPRSEFRIAFFERYGKLGHLRAWTQVQRAVVSLAEGSSFVQFESDLQTLCEGLAQLVADWDVQDEAGQPLPNPTRPEAFYDLTLGEEGEIAWVIGQLRKRLEPRGES